MWNGNKFKETKNCHHLYQSLPVKDLKIYQNFKKEHDFIYSILLHILF